MFIWAAHLGYHELTRFKRRSDRKLLHIDDRKGIFITWAYAWFPFFSYVETELVARHQQIIITIQQKRAAKSHLKADLQPN